MTLVHKELLIIKRLTKHLVCPYMKLNRVGARIFGVAQVSNTMRVALETEGEEERTLRSSGWNGQGANAKLAAFVSTHSSKAFDGCSGDRGLPTDHSNQRPLFRRFYTLSFPTLPKFLPVLPERIKSPGSRLG